MAFATAVAGPGFGVVNAEVAPTGGNLTLGEMGEGTEQGDAGEGARLGSAAHRLHKLRPAVGIDGVVAAVVGHHDKLQAVALGDAHGYRQHDAVAEWHDGGLHVVSGIVAVGDLLPTLQQRTLEILRH